MSFDLSKKRKIIAGSTIAIVMVLIISIFVLPKYAARYVIKDQLIEMGLVFSGVETFNIDLWNSEVRFGPVQVSQSLGSEPILLKEMILQYDLGEVINKRILFNKAIFSNLDIRFDRLEDGSFAINSIPLQTFLPPSEDPDVEVSDEAPWHAGIDQFELRDSHFYFEDFQGENVDFQIKNLDLASFHTWEPDLQGSFKLNGALNEIGVAMDGVAQLFSDQIKISVKERFSEIGVAKIERATGPLGFEKSLGAVHAELDHVIEIFPAGDVKLQTNGRLEVVGLSLAHELGFQGDWEKGEITFTNQFEADPQQKGHSSGNFKIVGENFNMTMKGQALLSADTLTLQGDDIQAPIDFELTPVFTGNFAVAGEGIVAMLTGLVDTKATSMALQLRDMAVELGDPTAVKTNGELKMSGFATTLPESETSPAVDALLEGLNLSFAANASVPVEGTPIWDAKITGEIAGVDMSIDKGEALKMTMAGAELTHLAADSSIALAGDAILLKNMQIHVTDKLIYGQGGDTAAEAEPTSEEAETIPSKIKGLKLPFALRLDRFAIIDGANLSVADASVTPDVESEIAITQFEMTNIDSEDPSKSMEFSIAALINEFTNLDASGNAKLFSDAPFIDAALNITGLQLHPVSPYAAKHAGMHLNNGRLSMQAIGRAEEGQLKSEINLDIMALEFEPLTPEDQERLSAAAGIPIDTAVGLLEDADGRIELTIPIEGDLNNPDVNIDQIINKAIGGAIQAAAAGAFKLLFPPALLISLIAESDDGGVVFKPVEFNAGEAQENAAGKVNVEGLAHLMTERPKLMITLCGRSTQPDFKLRFDTLRDQRIAERQAVKKAEAEAAVVAAAEAAAIAAGEATTGQVLVVPIELPQIVLSGDDLVEIRESARNDNADLADSRTLSVKRKLVSDYSIDALRINECRATEDPISEALPHVAVSL